MSKAFFIQAPVAAEAGVRKEIAKVDAAVTFLQPQKFGGGEVLRMMLEYGPDIASVVISLIALFQKQEHNFSIVLPGGKSLDNPTPEQAEEALKKSFGTVEKREGEDDA